jgi:hypothetical protein
MRNYALSPESICQQGLHYGSSCIIRLFFTFKGRLRAGQTDLWHSIQDTHPGRNQKIELKGIFLVFLADLSHKVTHLLLQFIEFAYE